MSNQRKCCVANDTWCISRQDISIVHFWSRERKIEAKEVGVADRSGLLVKSRNRSHSSSHENHFRRRCALIVRPSSSPLAQDPSSSFSSSRSRRMRRGSYPDERTPPSNYYYIKRSPWLFVPLQSEGRSPSSSLSSSPYTRNRATG